MRVLVTGAFGVLGQNVMEYLHQQGHEITCLDLKNRKNYRSYKNLNKKYDLNVIWGDILDTEIVSTAVKNQECIIHLAAVKPPLSENKPSLARKINVEGTKNIIEAAKTSENKIKIIYPSSVSIYGPQPPSAPILTAETPINPTDTYTTTKALCEKQIKESGLSWTILRITAVPALSLDGNETGLLYDIPLDQKLEFLHIYDAALAIANTVSAETEEKVLLLGGGKNCQLINKEFILKYLEFLGIRNIPETIFKSPQKDEDWFYTNWMDTKNSQELLKYQRYSFDDFLELFEKTMRRKIPFVRMMGFIARRIIIRKSPYNKKSKN